VQRDDRRGWKIHVLHATAGFTEHFTQRQWHPLEVGGDASKVYGGQGGKQVVFQRTNPGRNPPSSGGVAQFLGTVRAC